VALVIVADTDVLIAYLRGTEIAQEWLPDVRARIGRIRISVLTGTEILKGMRSAERSETYRLLGSCHALPVTDAIARRAGELGRQYRASHGTLSLSDYVVAATAELHGLELATLNVKHFPMFPGLRPPFTA
jgi:predicted nucleic acid-binding protein